MQKIQDNRKRWILHPDTLVKWEIRSFVESEQGHLGIFVVNKREIGTAVNEADSQLTMRKRLGE